MTNHSLAGPAGARDWAALAGRILLAAIFLISGFNKIGGFAGTAAYIASKGLPLPELGAALAIVLELAGGIMLVAGYRARLAALAIFAFLIPTTFLFHAYWQLPPDRQMADFLSFWKNVAIMGGMLMVFAMGPGRLSVDRG